MKTRALLLALPLLAAGALGACRDDSASVQIQQICFPTDDCTFSNECDNSAFSPVVLDRTVGDHVDLYVQLENQTPSNEDLDVGRTNTRDAQIDQVTIEYDGPAIPRQVMGANVWIPSDSTQLIKIRVIPAGFAAAGGALDAFASATGREMTARVRVGGSWYDGSRFETAEFPITVKVCEGCLGSGCGTLATCPPNSSGQLPIVCMDPAGAGTT
jgi:hypothetical protein